MINSFSNKTRTKKIIVTPKIFIVRETMNIRTATNRDRDDVLRIYSSAFPDDESESVSRLAVDLLSENTTPETLCLLAEAEGAVVGHIAFSPVAIGNSETCQGYILAPLAVQTDYQKRRIGSRLIEYGLRQLSLAGVTIVFVYGDPDYYGRFGFSADAAIDYKAPYALEYPFGWQAVVLCECAIEKPPVTITCVPALCHSELW